MSGSSTAKGLFLGDTFYWAPTDWMDSTVGATYLSKRGWSQTGAIRMRPWENAKLDISYYGVIDRGLPEPGGIENQGGHEAHLGFDALLPHGWRTVVDLNQLSSLTYRLAWRETFSQAVNSEVRNTTFATKSFSGFNLMSPPLSYKNFVSSSPQTYVSLRTAPEVRFGSVDQAPFENSLFIFLSIPSPARSIARTPSPASIRPHFVERSEIAPSVTIPLHSGPLARRHFQFHAAFHLLRRAIQPTGQYRRPGSFLRTTEEFIWIFVRPLFERVWGSQDSGTKWKHIIEPEIVYSYVNGVNDFGRFVRFDDDETLTDTNEFEYGVTPASIPPPGDSGSDGGIRQLGSWPRNISSIPPSAALWFPASATCFKPRTRLRPLPFQDEPTIFRRCQRLCASIPANISTRSFIVDFDPPHGQFTAIGTLLKLKPYRE